MSTEPTKIDKIYLAYFINHVDDYKPRGQSSRFEIIGAYKSEQSAKLALCAAIIDQVEDHFKESGLFSVQGDLDESYEHDFSDLLSDKLEDEDEITALVDKHLIPDLSKDVVSYLDDPEDCQDRRIIVVKESAKSNYNALAELFKHVFKGEYVPYSKTCSICETVLL